MWTADRGGGGLGAYDVSIDLPLWIAHADAPLPRCRAMMLVSFTGFRILFIFVSYCRFNLI